MSATTTTRLSTAVVNQPVAEGIIYEILPVETNSSDDGKRSWSRRRMAIDISTNPKELNLICFAFEEQHMGLLEKLLTGMKVRVEYSSTSRRGNYKGSVSYWNEHEAYYIEAFEKRRGWVPVPNTAPTVVAAPAAPEAKYETNEDDDLPF